MILEKKSSKHSYIATARNDGHASSISNNKVTTYVAWLLVFIVVYGYFFIDDVFKVINVLLYSVLD